MKEGEREREGEKPKGRGEYQIYVENMFVHVIKCARHDVYADGTSIYFTKNAKNVFMIRLYGQGHMAHTRTHANKLPLAMHCYTIHNV